MPFGSTDTPAFGEANVPVFGPGPTALKFKTSSLRLFSRLSKSFRLNGR